MTAISVPSGLRAVRIGSDHSTSAWGAPSVHVSDDGMQYSRRRPIASSMRRYVGADDFRSGNNSGLFAARYSSRCWTVAFAVFGLVGIALTSPSHAQAPNLGTAAAYAVLAGSTVTNTGPSASSGTLVSAQVPRSPGFPREL